MPYESVIIALSIIGWVLMAFATVFAAKRLHNLFKRGGWFAVVTFMGIYVVAKTEPQLLPIVFIMVAIAKRK